MATAPKVPLKYMPALWCRYKFLKYLLKVKGANEHLNVHKHLISKQNHWQFYAKVLILIRSQKCFYLQILNCFLMRNIIFRFFMISFVQDETFNQHKNFSSPVFDNKNVLSTGLAWNRLKLFQEIDINHDLFFHGINSRFIGIATDKKYFLWEI